MELRACNAGAEKVGRKLELESWEKRGVVDVQAVQAQRTARTDANRPGEPLQPTDKRQAVHAMHPPIFAEMPSISHRMSDGTVLVPADDKAIVFSLTGAVSVLGCIHAGVSLILPQLSCARP
jgi:hypothetical protein